MSNNYDDYSSPIKSNGEGKNGMTALKAVIAVIVALAVGFSAYSFLRTYNEEKNAPAPETQDLVPMTAPETEPPETEPSETSAPETEPPAVRTDLEAVDRAHSLVHSGSTVLVNTAYQYVFSAENNKLSNLYVNKTKSYKLATSSLDVQTEMLPFLNSMLDDLSAAVGTTNVIVQVAYRSQDDQKGIYDKYVARNGEAAAVGNVSKPGESDFHTGYSVDLRLFSDGAYHPIKNTSEYNWLTENCGKYGFVVRFPDAKADITGITYDAGLCLRYVGIPHAAAMNSLGWCLEEYALGISDYPYDGDHLTVDAPDGKTYEIYYCLAGMLGEGEDESKTISIYVPKDKPYTVTGNNADGFIIAAEK